MRSPSPAPGREPAQNRIFVEETARWQKQKATALGVAGGETGSVTFVQRFDRALGCFVHLHVVVLDSERSERVFTREAKGCPVVFHPDPAPSREDIAAVAARVAERMLRWMRRRNLLDERPPKSDNCMQASSGEARLVNHGRVGVYPCIAVPTLRPRCRLPRTAAPVVAAPAPAIMEPPAPERASSP